MTQKLRRLGSQESVASYRAAGDIEAIVLDDALNQRCRRRYIVSGRLALSEGGNFASLPSKLFTLCC